MGTPFVAFLGPSKLDGFRLGVPPESQPAFIPKPFMDAMEVREEVYVREQKVPRENEFDADDARACHWVVYASINKTEEAEVRDDDGNVVQPRKSSTRSTPIGTIRLVPFPHDPHPKLDGRYRNGVLEGGEDNSETKDALSHRAYGTDRPTKFHDGKEPYVKLGRLAVIKEFRGNNLAGLLVNTALRWIKENPSFFDPSIRELGLEQLGAADETDIPQWGGLVCVHAQEQIADIWKQWGFEVDEGMGRWWEEGIPHIGMFARLDFGEKLIRI